MRKNKNVKNTEREINAPASNITDGLEKTKIEVNISAFIARALVRGTTYGDLDKIKPQELDGYKEAEKQAEKYYLYYREYDVNTEWYCRKAALFVELVVAEEENKRGEKIKNLMLDFLKKHWGDMYAYIEKAPEPLIYDKFWLLSASVKRYTALGKKNSSQRWSAELPVFIYIANLLGKKIDFYTPEYSNQFQGIFQEESRIRENNTFKMDLSPEKEQLADKLWRGLTDKFHGRVPETLNQYLASETAQADRKNCYLYSYGNVAGLPLGAMRDTFVNNMKLRHEVNYLVWVLPDDKLELTQEMEEMAMRVFVQSLFLRAVAAECGKDRQYALKYMEIKSGEDKNINKKRFQEMKAEIEGLKRENKALKWKNKELEEQINSGR